MRRARIIEEGGGYYHVMSRIVDRRMVIDDSEKGTLRYLMRGMEGFSGVEIVTYAILDNHFHILLYVPERQDVDDAELIRRLGCLYSKPLVKSAEDRVGACPLPRTADSPPADDLSSRAQRSGVEGSRVL